MSLHWGMAEQIVAYDGDGILLVCKVDEQDDFRKSCEDLCELIQSGIKNCPFKKNSIWVDE